MEKYKGVYAAAIRCLELNSGIVETQDPKP